MPVEPMRTPPVQTTLVLLRLVHRIRLYMFFFSQPMGIVNVRRAGLTSLPRLSIRLSHSCRPHLTTSADCFLSFFCTNLLTSHHPTHAYRSYRQYLRKISLHAIVFFCLVSCVRPSSIYEINKNSSHPGSNFSQTASRRGRALKSDFKS